MKTLTKFAAVLAFSLTASLSSKADTIVFVGSWNINDGASWLSNPLAYSGVGAAQFLFGAGDYEISTVDNQVAHIDNQAYYNIFGVGNGIFAQDYFRGTEGVTHYWDVAVFDPDTDTVSAYVSDLSGSPYANGATINYAFRVTHDTVPDSGATIALLGGAFVGLAALRRRFVS